MRFSEYVEPETLEEAIAQKLHYGDKAVLLAGGTDVVPKLNTKTIRPKAVIGLHRIAGLDDIGITPEGLFLGAMVRLREISLHSKLIDDYRIIQTAANHVSSMQIRNIATIGGNACNASPSADAVEGLLALGAVCRITGKNGDREMPLDDFFLGPGKTALRNDEILQGFFVPKPAERTGASYIKYAIRGNTDISIAGVGVALTFDDAAAVTAAHISLGAVGPTPVRAKKAEALLIQKKLDAALIAATARVASENISPISDQRATAEYRREMIRIQTMQAIKDAASYAMHPENRTVTRQ
jgi:carbon-monoxide dehydrogenase medium subunit